MFPTSAPSSGRLLSMSCEGCPPHLRRKKWSLFELEVLEEVYKGNFSLVERVKCVRTGEVLALKKYPKATLTKLSEFQVRREVEIHSKLSHPNIVGLYAVFEDDECFYLVQEWAQLGDMYGLQHQLGGALLEDDVIKFVLKPFLGAVVYLHEQGVVHRDIKPENLLFTKDLQLKLADFGLSINALEERPVTRAGTLDYMAPEVLICPDKRLPMDNKWNTRLQYSNTVDTWAVGILTYELIIGKPPFQASKRADVCHKILNWEPTRPMGMSDACWNFIYVCLQKDSMLRPTCEQLKDHPFLVHGRHCSMDDLLSWSPHHQRVAGFPRCPSMPVFHTASSRTSSRSSSRSSDRTSSQSFIVPAAVELPALPSSVASPASASKDDAPTQHRLWGALRARSVPDFAMLIPKAPCSPSATGTHSPSTHGATSRLSGSPARSLSNKGEASSTSPPLFSRQAGMPERRQSPASARLRHGLPAPPPRRSDAVVPDTRLSATALSPDKTKHFSSLEATGPADPASNIPFMAGNLQVMDVAAKNTNFAVVHVKETSTHGTGATDCLADGNPSVKAALRRARTLHLETCTLDKLTGCLADEPRLSFSINTPGDANQVAQNIIQVPAAETN